MILLAITRRFETLGIDPLVGKILWDNVAVSSPCIGQYKLTCLQNALVFSLFHLRALSSPLSTLVVLAGRFHWVTVWYVAAFVLLLRGLSWVILRGLRCIPPWWLSLYCTFVSLVALLSGGCYYLAHPWASFAFPSSGCYYTAPL